MAQGARKPGRPRGAPHPRLAALQLDPEDEHYRAQCCYHQAGYAALRHEGKQTVLHRVITSAPPGLVVDHINGDGMDNRKANLRVVAQAVNTLNIAGPRCKNTSGYLGVRYRPDLRKWTAEIRQHRKGHYIGVYPTAYEAHLARLLKEKELWGIQPRREQAFKEAGITA